MFENALIIALIVLFIHACMWEGMILSWLSDLFAYLPNAIRKPLYECVICMTPYYGTLLLIALFPSVSLAEAVLTILCASGINVLFSILLPE